MFAFSRLDKKGIQTRPFCLFDFIDVELSILLQLFTFNHAVYTSYIHLLNMIMRGLSQRQVIMVNVTNTGWAAIGIKPQKMGIPRVMYSTQTSEKKYEG